MAEMINAANDAVDDQNLTLRQSLIDTITYVHSLLKYGMNQDALLRLHEMQREAKQMVDPNARVITEVLSKMVEAHVYPHRMQEEPWTFEEARKLALICRHDAKGIQDQVLRACVCRSAVRMLNY